MTYEEIMAEIEALSSEKLKEFSAKLTPTKDKIYGVKIPELRRLAKRIAKEGGEEFLAHEKLSFEEKMLHGFTLCYRKSGFEEFCRDIEGFADMIDNWAVCDCVASACARADKRQEEFLPVVERLIGSEKEFHRRFGLVMLLDHYVRERYAETIFSACERVKKGEYYVNMAIAWLLSVCYVKLNAETKAYLKRCTLDEDVLHKTKRKILESFRVSAEDKENIRKNGVK